METMRDFIFLPPKSLQMVIAAPKLKKKKSFLGRKAVTKLDSREITLPTKVHLVKAMVVPAVMCGCEVEQ